MKTETERLKESTDRQYAKERMDELGKYIAHLFVRFDEQIVVSRKATNIEFVLLVVWVVSIFVAPSIENILWLVWLITFGYNLMTTHKKLLEIGSEMDGAFKVMEILGMVDENKTDRKRKRRKKSVNPFAGLVEKWKENKAAKQKEAYA